MLACFRGNRKQASPKFYWPAIVSHKAGGSPLLRSARGIYQRGLAISGLIYLPSSPLLPPRFVFAEHFVTASRIRLSDSINSQWMLVKSALLAVIRADVLAKGHVRSSRRYGRRPRSGLSGETSSLPRKNDRNLRNGEESVGVGGVSGPLINCLARKTELLCPIPHVSARTGDHFDRRFPNFATL